MKYLILLLLLIPGGLFAGVEVNPEKSGAARPFTTNPVACTVVSTPADADMATTAFCYRQGKFLFIQFTIQWSGAGTAGALTSSLASLPGAPVMDTTVFVNSGGNSNQTEALLGYCKVFSAGASAWFIYSVVYKTTTTVEFAAGSAHLQGNTLASGSSVNCEAKIPIVGWN